MNTLHRKIKHRILCSKNMQRKKRGKQYSLHMTTLTTAECTDVELPLQDNYFSPHISHEACLPSSRRLNTMSIHHFHYCISPFTTLICCCTVALRNRHKLYPNDVMKFGQLMQNCKLVTIHRNTTTGNNITGVRRCSMT